MDRLEKVDKMELIFERYIPPQFAIVKNDEVCGIVNNDEELCRICVQIKEYKLTGYFVKDITSGELWEILQGGRIKGFKKYNEMDVLLNKLLGLS